MDSNKFTHLCAQLIALIPEILGVALISDEGGLLFEMGEMIADEPIVGVAGAALMRLAEHISAGLTECAAQEICVRCKQHAAFFVPSGKCD